ncbi:hypothetical protein C8J57DRAFT_1242175 [Mycena rebaudengoi]|nr:hypothetical protein C8J57DRAFT_1242175 [Mycena rebaudengoi]
MSCGRHIYIIFVRGPSCTAAGGERAYVPVVGGSVLASPPHGGVASVPAKRFRLRNVARDLVWMLTAQAHRKSSLPPQSTSYNACLSWYQLWSAVSNFRFLPSCLGHILKQTQKSYDREIPVALEEFKRATTAQCCVSNDGIAVGRVQWPGPPTFTPWPFKEKELKSEEPKLIELQEVDGQAGQESKIERKTCRVRDGLAELTGTTPPCGGEARTLPPTAGVQALSSPAAAPDCPENPNTAIS